MNKPPSKKEQLLEAGLDAFYEIGFDNTSIDEIVKRANCGKGTFYRYFKSKDMLFEQLESNFNQNLTNELEKNCKPEYEIRKYLFVGMKTFMSIFKKHQKLGLVKFERENRLRQKDRHQSACKAMPNIFYLRGYIEKAIKEKIIRPIDPEMLIVLLLGAGHFLLFRDFKLGVPFNDQELENIVDIALRGVLPS